MRRTRGFPSRPVRNFGRNVRFNPRRIYAPTSEDEVLGILDRHADGHIRAMGSLHSWSETAVSNDVLLDLRLLDVISVWRGDDGRPHVTVGGGCRLDRLLPELRRHGYTLPTVGAVLEQTVAGAISTGTHGSGDHSLSHYVEQIRVAAYDAETGKARAYEWGDGPELRAARCALGCMGVVLTVTFPLVPEYRVEESTAAYDSLDEALAQEADWPLQQLVWVPYLWRFYAYRRSVVGDAPSRTMQAKARTYRVINLLGRDILAHVAVMAMARRPLYPARVPFMMRRLFPLLFPPLGSVTDRSDEMITLRHHYFRHVEMELFIPSERMPEAIRLVRDLIAVASGEQQRASEETRAELAGLGLLSELEALRGTYTHHYPIVIRRVLPDDAMLAMSTGDQTRYTISFFSYQPDISAFGYVTRFAARALVQLHGARLHWGKLNPLTTDETASLYPDLDAFRRCCEAVDPQGVFTNAYTRRALGLG